jgi:Mg-chelatase subunit ChlD
MSFRRAACNHPALPAPIQATAGDPGPQPAPVRVFAALAAQIEHHVPLPDPAQFMIRMETDRIAGGCAVRNALFFTLFILAGGHALATERLEPRGLAAITPGELRIEIHSPAADLETTTGEMSVEVQGAASTIGGVRFIDMMLVMDTSMSLRDSDPDGYRTAAAVGLIESLSPKSDTSIGVVGFNDRSKLIQPLTADRREVTRALKELKRSGGTNLAAGIHSALEELNRNGRPESSRVIVLFTDGMSNEKKARDAALQAQNQGVAIQTMLLGENLKGGFLLEEIATATGGSFAWVLDPSELPEAFLNMRTTGVDSVALSVNGSDPIPANLTGGTFTGSLPLAVGENRIVALATSLDGQTRESSVMVNVLDTSCASLEVAALQNGQPARSLDERAVEIVVDASRSMWGQIGGKSKMAIAQEILLDASSTLPEDLDLALRAYGNTSPSEAANCSDSSLLVPFGSASRAPIERAISELRPTGQTPIAYALKQAAADFEALDSERTLVLVTDGIESCGGDPVAAAHALREQGIMIHLIGFGLGNTPDEDTASLQAIADASGGKFFTANTADELRGALEATVGTRFRVIQENDVVARGILGSTRQLFLPTGDYRIELDSVPAHSMDVSLAARDRLTLMLQKDGRAITHAEYRDLLEPTSCENARAGRIGEDEGTTLSAVDAAQPTRVDWPRRSSTLY